MRATKHTLIIAAGLLALSGAGAQTAPQRKVEVDRIIHAVPGEPAHQVFFERHIGAAPPGEDITFEFVSSEMSFEGKVVKGAPYSAQAVTETTQTLGDGNRISRKNTAAIYRDSEGRTRREQTLAAIGPWAASGDPATTIFINDPVAGANYVLDPRNRTARKMTLHGAGEHFQFAVAEFKHKIDEADRPAAGGIARAVEGRRSAVAPHTESLGKQVIEGVQAEGTRTTHTIPVGAIGNERPIEIVFERWFSPELQTVVLTRQNDPRTGETVYRLTNISRVEPLRSLFEVPPDYTVKEGPPMPLIEKLKTKPDGR